MRKFVSILLMFAMLTMPGQFALADSGGGGGRDPDDGSQISALSRPSGFLTVVVTIAVIQLIFSPIFSLLPPERNTPVTLTLTKSQTLVFLLYALVEFFRYFVYQLLALSPLYLSLSPSSSGTSQSSKESVWTAANSTLATTSSTEDQQDEKQEVIAKAVEKALRDPELAVKYLQYASPEVQAAVSKALKNQAPGLGSSFSTGKGRVYFTGHSMGGTKAQIAGALFPADFVYSFNSPKSGNPEFAEHFPIPVLRFVSKRDPVQSYPSDSADWAHVGNKIGLESTDILWIGLSGSFRWRGTCRSPIASLIGIMGPDYRVMLFN